MFQIDTNQTVIAMRTRRPCNAWFGARRSLGFGLCIVHCCLLSVLIGSIGTYEYGGTATFPGPSCDWPRKVGGLVSALV